MNRLFNSFLRDESGAVTVDWVVLTASVIALNLLLVFTPVRNAIRGLAESIGVNVEEMRGEFFGDDQAG